MDEYIEKPDVQYILHIESDKKVEKRLIDYCLVSVADVFEDTGLTADVYPQKHGRWIYVGSVRSWDELKCSACNSAFSTEDRDLILNWDFCPHCGARMDGDTE